MSGVLTALAGSGSGDLTMNVGTGTYVIKTTIYVTGYIAAGSQADVLAPTIGTLAPATAKSATVTALYHQSSTGYGVSGQHNIEVSGNRSAGFITDVKVDGVSIGTVGAPTYNSTPNTTTFPVGGSTATGLFGSTAGVNKRITIT